jgi:hypothetical protein
MLYRKSFGLAMHTPEALQQEDWLIGEALAN